MRKCSACGRKFRLLAKNRYEVVKRPVGFNCLQFTIMLLIVLIVDARISLECSKR